MLSLLLLVLLMRGQAERLEGRGQLRLLARQVRLALALPPVQPYDGLGGGEGEMRGEWRGG